MTNGNMLRPFVVPEDTTISDAEILDYLVPVFMSIFIYRSNTERRSLSGTSMACPTVAGVVATYLQRFPNYTPRQIRDQLIADSTPDVVNLWTFRGSNLASVIAQTTTNKFAYTGRCNDSKLITVFN